MEEPTPERERPLGFSKKMYSAIVTMMWVQLAMMAFTGLTFDDSYGSRMCLHASTGYLMMLGWIGHRRGNAPTRVDVYLAATGFFLWLPVAVAVEAAVRVLFFGGF